MKANYILIIALAVTNPTVYACEEFTGFWENDCSEPFGLQIISASKKDYSISFCGPGGCFEPGTYRPNTTIHNDKLYKVIDGNHIKVWGHDGWSNYYKCDINTNPKLRYKDCDKKSPILVKGKGKKECRG